MPINRLCRVWVACVCAWGLAVSAWAQQRPLVTEDPETIGAGLMLIEGGFERLQDVFYPVSGLQGNLLRLPTLGLSVGVGSIAEIQFDGGVYQRLNITDRKKAVFPKQVTSTGDSTSSPEDWSFATKIRVMSETPGRPSLGLRFATKLPTASNESGLGLDTTDFYMTLLIGKTVQSVRVVGNAGIGILADPTGGDPNRGQRQNDVVTLGVSVARAVRQGFEVVGDVNGRISPREEVIPGTESRGAMRVGVRFTKSAARIDGGVIIGMTSRDTSIGFTAGVTYVFKAFTVP